MAELKITPAGGGAFRVEVSDGASVTSHTVTVSPSSLERLEWKGTPEDLIRRSFAFLLEREGSSSILAEFEISDIGRYFAGFDEAARRGFA